MKQHYINRLFYSKYPFKIIIQTIDTVSFQSMKKWLKKNISHYKTYSTAYSSLLIYTKKEYIKTSIFFENEKDFLSTKQEFEKLILEIYQPYDNKHIELLKENTHFLIRRHLIYKKYRYSILFRYNYGTKNCDIRDWAISNFEDKLNIDIKIYFMNGNLRLYLNDESDLVLVKLLWMERIHRIVHVKTFDEVESISNNNP